MSITSDDPADYRTVNREGWDLLSLLDDPSTFQADTARNDLDRFGWIPWEGIRDVLCLAAAGGQQAPRFAALGYNVTLVDLSPGQLERDREVCREMGLTVEFVEADMLDLSQLRGRQFDLVYQPVSACYVPDVLRLYREVASVTRTGGHYMVEHWSPAQLRVAPDAPWDGSAYRISRPADSTEPLLWHSAEAPLGKQASCVHYVHTLGSLVGGLCESGFDVVEFREPHHGNVAAEPGSDEHMAAYLPPFISMLARRRAT